MILWIALRNLRVRAATTALTVAVVAVAAMAALAVPLIMRQLERGAADAVQVYDLLVTAKGSRQQAVLSTLFYMDVPLGNLPYGVYLDLAQDPRTARLVPFGLGDSFRGHPVVGSDEAFFDLRLSASSPAYARLAQGRAYAGPFEAVLGAEVARRHGLRPGASITTTHGLLDLGVDQVLAGHDDHDDGHDHAAEEQGHDDQHAHDGPEPRSAEAVALAELARLGAALAAAEDEASRAELRRQIDLALAAVEEASQAPQPDPSGDDGHVHGQSYEVVGVLEPTGGPIDGAVLVHIESVWLVHGQVDPASRGLTAIAFTATRPGDYFTIAQEIDARPDAQAVFTGAVFGQLRRMLARGEVAYDGLRLLLIAMATLTVWLNVYADARERRRFDARLRALGAAPPLRFSVVLLEAGATVTVGVLLGIGAAYGLSWLASAQAGPLLGFHLPAPAFDPVLVASILPLIPLGLLAALVPAIRAGRGGATHHL